MPLNKTTQAYIARILRQWQDNPPKPFAEMSIEEYREYVDQTYADLIEPPLDSPYKTHFVNGQDGNVIPIRIYTPERAKRPYPCLLFLHGGGFVTNLRAHYGPCTRIADATQFKIIDVEYRLAPEHPFPAALNDVYSVAHWLFTQADALDIDTNQIAIAGYSSGGGLAALTVNRTRQDPLIRFMQQILISPCVDLSLSLCQYRHYEDEDKLIDMNFKQWLFHHYVTTGTFLQNPALSPYWESDLSEIIATTIIVAEYDFLRSDAEAYAEKLQQAGVQVNKVVCAGQLHNYFIARGLLNEGLDPTDVIIETLLER